jgi:uncharacterized protein
MKTDVNFSSAGLRLAGHLYTPDDESDGPRPAIVVSHPASGVKEQAAGLYAERLAREGFVTLTFDAAFQGESEGEPRGLEDPAHRVEDIKAGVSFLSVLDAVDTKPPPPAPPRRAARLPGPSRSSLTPRKRRARA